MLTDSHCHLYKEYYEDINNVILESIKNNVTRFINNGCDSETNKEVIELINKFSNMYGAIGIHPENVLSYSTEDIKFIENNLNNNKIIAIGEIGLDYHYTKDNKESQIKLFKIQLSIAEKNNMPVIIHSREATLDTLNTIKEYKVRGVIHSFSGSLETAKEYIKLGYLIGVNGVVTFKNSNIKNVIKELPLESIVIETDSPYLAPVPHRGKCNESAFIIHTAAHIAQHLSIPLNEIASTTSANAKLLFKI